MDAGLKLLVWACLCALLLTACVGDYRTRRIPNALSVAGAVIGLSLQVAAPAGDGFFAPGNVGGDGLLRAGGAVLVTAALGILLWRVRAFGAGDAKLLAACAAFFGPAGVVPLLVLTFLMGGVLALAWPSTRLWAEQWGLPLGANDGRLPYSFAITAAALASAATLQSGVISFPYI